MKKLLSRWTPLIAVGVGLVCMMSALFPQQPLRPYLVGLLVCYILIGISDVRGWRLHRKIKKYVDVGWFFVRARDDVRCTCGTRRFGGLCRTHAAPFFW